ncbi:MAG: RNA-binding transcriptional accessory protein [Bacteroidaceae bacterium]|nr:RNA-binding transcriptional accessory protein [Bacteroidaceae bacterium]
MNAEYISIIVRETGLKEHQVENTLKLLENGATIPFISRYRKESTGGLDEIKVTEVSNALERLETLTKRKETVINTINGLDKLTPELKTRIDHCWDSTELEDIYAPYKPHRKTRADAAREKGLEPLAEFLMKQNPYVPLDREAQKYISKEKGVESVHDALQGAMDIIAEQVSLDEGARNLVRNGYRRSARIYSHLVRGKEAEAQKYRDWFDFNEPLNRCASHRLLAMRRGENEGMLRVSIEIDDEKTADALSRRYVHGKAQISQLVDEAVQDSYYRLLQPSIENEFAASSKNTADIEAIRIFARNLEQLLMASPLGQKAVLGIDPGFRTGCKVVCLNPQGTLLHNETIYPHPPHNEARQASAKIQALVEQYRIDAIAIGNGTAGRETKEFIEHLRLPANVQIYSVNEDGASIYSASKTARDELPDFDVTVRGAVSIGRRLMDPLAELVKIDPSSIGVGQYQKDVNQAELKHSLDQTVISCVNRVGVNVNTASTHLLTYISGLGPQLAQNIVDYRTDNGPFSSRKELMKVPRMGAKAFEQSAGFLRVPGGNQPLDNSAVHPESYPIVEQMAKDLGCKVEDLMKSSELRAKIDINRYITDKVGLPTLTDIMQELEKPGRDPRGPLKKFEFSNEVHTIDDVKAGMVLPGIVSNITNFGAFVDIGVHVKGLIHISQLAPDKFIKDPTQVVSLQQQVLVKVLDVDLERQRISLQLGTIPFCSL